MELSENPPLRPVVFETTTFPRVRQSVRILVWSLVCAGSGMQSKAAAQQPEVRQTKVDFEVDVLPILKQHCFECHGPKRQKAGLRLDTQEGLFSGEKDFIPIVPGAPERSLLWERVNLPAEDPDIMPPAGDPLSPEELVLLKSWIATGAEWKSSTASPTKTIQKVDQAENPRIQRLLQSPPTEPIEFGRDIRPILSSRCFACHGPDEGHREAGLRLDQREAAVSWKKGSRRAIAPGDVRNSEVIRRIFHDDAQQRMPPLETGHTLTETEQAFLLHWIQAGAPWEEHWSFVKPHRPETPITTCNDPWIRNEIDAFVLERIRQDGLQPSPEADRITLIRRLSLDLIGLPPTPEETRAFLTDAAPDAYEQLVDRLLASPAYGERWASMWLDLARYADSAGHGSDPLRTIWRYRDWVIDALNSNMPYDQFTREQLAGDLLPNATTEQKLATAFHRNTMTNTEGGTDDEEFRVLAVKDRANTTAQVWMGLTMGCAQCHSHKFDPISQEEYYQFYAFFNQTADTDKNDDSPRLRTPTQEQVRQIEVLTEQIADWEKRLKNPHHDVAAQQSKWETEERKRQTDWQVLQPIDLHSEGGADLRRLPDHSILVTGRSPQTDTYTIQARTNHLEQITAIRLECLSDERLPNGGPGRSPNNGNFVLNDIEVRHLAGSTRTTRKVEGRFVRITNLGKSVILSLAEVQVLSEGRNVAADGIPKQSSTAYDGVASRAIDQITDGQYFRSNSVTHTNTETDPWWEIELDNTYSIQSLNLWNRTDADLEKRLSDFKIQIFDGQRNLVWETVLQEPPDPDLSIRPHLWQERPGLREVTADFSQKDWPATSLLTAEEKPSAGWAIAPQQGKDHHTVLTLSRPLEGGLLEITLKHSYGQEHNLGRFRLSVTSNPQPPAALAHELSESLFTAAAKRTKTQQAELADHYQTLDPQLREVRAKVDQLKSDRQAAPVATTPVMVELPPDLQRKTHVLSKGNFLNPRQEVHSEVPDSLHDWPEGEPRNRLGLANWLMSSQNPLTARVTANRYWAQLFGIGLVETEEDFGNQGSLPSHPLLLDWLAVELQQNGWDIKNLLKTIVTSATYRQSSKVRPEHLEKDPRNRLLSRAPRIRLEAERVRDNLLAISGLLSRKMYGPSVFPPQPEGMWQAAFNGQRKWETSTGEDRYRRGLYVFLRRTIPYPSMTTFDAPSRESCTLRRIRTNTPLQAFVTLNDPVYVEAAQALGRRMLLEAGSKLQAQIRHGLRLSLSREPEQEMVEILIDLYTREYMHYRKNREEARIMATNPLGPLPEDLDEVAAAAMTVVANVLLNLDAVLMKE